MTTTPTTSKKRTRSLYNDERPSARNQLIRVEIVDGKVVLGVCCFAHTLQLAVLDLLNVKRVKDVLNAARRVVKKLRTQNVMIFISKFQLFKPIVDCATCWSSSHDILLLQLQQHYSLVNVSFHLIAQCNLLSNFTFQVRPSMNGFQTSVRTLDRVRRPLTPDPM